MYLVYQTPTDDLICQRVIDKVRIDRDRNKGHKAEAYIQCWYGLYYSNSELWWDFKINQWDCWLLNKYSCVQNMKRCIINIVQERQETICKIFNWKLIKKICGKCVNWRWSWLMIKIYAILNYKKKRQSICIE